MAPKSGDCVVFLLPDQGQHWECGTVVRVEDEVVCVRRDEDIFFVNARDTHRITAATILSEEYDDLLELPDSHVGLLLWALRSRHAAGHTVTPLGRRMCCIVPNQHAAPAPAAADALLAKLEAMYREMRTSRPANQCLVLQGCAGSGKTEALRAFIRLLPQLSSGSPAVTATRRIALAQQVLEAFGNARTAANANSTRFTSLLQAQFCGNGQLVGAFWRAYLLERTRLSYTQRRGASFHAVYYLLAGPLAEGLHLLEQRRYPMVEVDDDDAAGSREAFLRTAAAMTDLGLSPAEQQAIWHTLAGILHLTRVDFEQWGAGEAVVSDGSRDYLTWAADCWGVSRDQLERCVTTATIHTPGEPITKPLSAAAAYTCCEHLAQAVYRQLFDTLVQRVNILTNSPQMHSWIGFLDGPGWDADPRSRDGASLGQLVANVTAEWLRARVAEDYFGPAAEEIAREGLPGPRIDPSPRPGAVVGLVFGAYPRLGPGLRVGLLPLLDDECAKGEAGSEASFLAKLAEAYADAEHLTLPTTGEPVFTVDHPQGPVKYNCRGWVAPNMDALTPEVRQLLLESASEFTRSLVPGISGQALPPALAHQPLAAGVYQQLQAIFSFALPHCAAAHFAWCVQAPPGAWQPAAVLPQLVAADLPAALRYAQFAALTSLEPAAFSAAYRALLEPRLRRRGDNTPALAELLRQRYAQFRCHVGASRVYLSPLLRAELDAARQDALGEAAAMVQRFCRAALSGLHLEALVESSELFMQLVAQCGDDEAFDRQVLEMQQQKEKSRLLNAFAVVLHEVAVEATLQRSLSPSLSPVLHRTVAYDSDEFEEQEMEQWVAPRSESAVSTETDELEQLRRICREELRRAVTGDDGSRSREIAVQEEVWETVNAQSAKLRDTQNSHIEHMELEHLLSQHARLEKEEEAHRRTAAARIEKERKRRELREQLYQNERLHQLTQEKAKAERLAALRERAVNNEVKLALARERRQQLEQRQLEQKLLQDWVQGERQHTAEVHKLWANCKFQEAERQRLLEQERRTANEQQAQRRAQRVTLEQWREQERRRELAEAAARRERERQERSAQAALAQLRSEAEQREKQERRLLAQQWQREQQLRLKREQERDEIKQRFHRFTQHSLSADKSPHRTKSTSSPDSNDQSQLSHASAATKQRIPEGLYSRLLGPGYLPPPAAKQRSKSALTVPEAAVLYKTKAGALRWK